MQITQVTFPQPDLCVMQVREDAAPYEAEIQHQYEQYRQYYPVRGVDAADVTRELIEQRYGVQTFRLEAINHLLTYEFPALRAQYCMQNGLWPLTDTDPHLLSDDETGFAVECTFALMPQHPVTGYTGHTLPGNGHTGVKTLLAQTAAACGVAPCDWAVQFVAESRIETLQEKLREGGSSLDTFLKNTDKTRAELHQDLCESVHSDLAQGIVLYNVARQEGLLTTPEQLEEEIARMEKISAMNNYARTNPTAQMNISVRLHNQRALEWLRAHNRFEEV